MRPTLPRRLPTWAVLAVVSNVLVVGVLMVGCDPGTVVSPELGVDDRNLSPTQRSRYLEDAAHLALRQLARKGPLDDQPPTIPDTLWHSLYGALVHVYNAIDLAARDTVVEDYAIHAYPRPSVRDLLVIVDTTATWVEAWRAGRSLTGNPAIDSLMVRYDLGVVQCSTWVGDWVTLRAMRDPLNMAGLRPLFEAVPDVLIAEGGLVFGDGNDIRAARESGGWRISYHLKWNCPTTCLADHYWTFRVGPHGAVEYVGSGGDPIP